MAQMVGMAVQSVSCQISLRCPQIPAVFAHFSPHISPPSRGGLNPEGMADGRGAVRKLGWGGAGPQLVLRVLPPRGEHPFGFLLATGSPGAVFSACHGLLSCDPGFRR